MPHEFESTADGKCVFTDMRFKIINEFQMINKLQQFESLNGAFNSLLAQGTTNCVKFTRETIVYKYNYEYVTTNANHLIKLRHETFTSDKLVTRFVAYFQINSA